MNSEYLYRVGFSMYHDNESKFIGHQAVIVAYYPEWQGGYIHNISTVVTERDQDVT
jgi:hypothetical protein